MQLHTVREASELLAWSQLSIRKLIAAGKLGVVRLGRSIRIPQAELDRIIREGTVRRKPLK
jgi:excisionase family DNA binding protein